MKALIEGGWDYKNANDEKKGDESGGDEEFDDEKAENKMVQTILDKANVSPNEIHYIHENRTSLNVYHKTWQPAIVFRSDFIF